MRIDLHAHSAASDGTDSPAALVGAARQAGLDVVALTDHDTTDGWDAAAEALPPGLTLVRGVELSCVSDGVSLHILGYLFDPHEPVLAAVLHRLRSSRVGRARRMVDLLVADGFALSWQRVLDIADGGSVGRPHIARALVEAGAVGTVDEAFRRFLRSDGPYYVHKADIDAVAAVEMIRAAGGVAVFAHPLARQRGRVVDDSVIAALAGAGLAGIEVDHPDHAPQDRAHLAGLAGDLGLVGTGSSDYHGRNKVTALGTCTTPPASYEALVAGATGRPPITG